MAMWIRQSTALTIKLGPFVDSTDGVTPETALTISQADVRLSKNGGAFAQKSDTSSATHDENGWYAVSLNVTDTNTLGRLQVAVNESGALPVWDEFMVVSAQVWDSYLSSDRLQVDVREYGDANLALTTQMKTDVKNNVEVGFRKNTAHNNFSFVMVDNLDHVTPKSGLAVTSERSLDGGAFAATANSVSEIGATGVYKINLAAGDLNGDVVVLKFTASGADDRYITVLTQS